MAQISTYTKRSDIHVMPWHIEAVEGIEKPCILVATMSGGEMVNVSLHVASEPTRE